MTIAPDSTSYPFLAIAQRENVPYADVLSIADGIAALLRGEPEPASYRSALRRLHETYPSYPGASLPYSRIFAVESARNLREMKGRES